MFDRLKRLLGIGYRPIEVVPAEPRYELIEASSSARANWFVVDNLHGGVYPFFRHESALRALAHLETEGNTLGLVEEAA